MAKELFICYDKLCERPTKTLMGLLSLKPEIKAQMYRPNKFPTIISRQHTLYIGQNCTENLIFDDAFNDYGTRIGYNGTTSWIVCTEFEWNGIKFNDFISELRTLCNKYNLKKEFNNFENDLDTIKTLFIHGAETWQGNIIKRSKDPALDRKSKWGKLWDIPYAWNDMTGTTFLTKKILNLVNDQDTRVRSYQYLFAMLKYYDKYVEDFLGITEE